MVPQGKIRFARYFLKYGSGDSHSLRPHLPQIFQSAMAGSRCSCTIVTLQMRNVGGQSSHNLQLVQVQLNLLLSGSKLHQCILWLTDALLVRHLYHFSYSHEWLVLGKTKATPCAGNALFSVLPQGVFSYPPLRFSQTHFVQTEIYEYKVSNSFPLQENPEAFGCIQIQFFCFSNFLIKAKPQACNLQVLFYPVSWNGGCGMAMCTVAWFLTLLLTFLLLRELLFRGWFC